MTAAWCKQKWSLSTPHRLDLSAGAQCFHLIYTFPLLHCRTSPKLLGSCWIMKLTGLICLVIWVTKAGSKHSAKSHNHNPRGRRHATIKRGWMGLSVTRDGQIQEEFSQRQADQFNQPPIFCFFSSQDEILLEKASVWLKTMGGKEFQPPCKRWQLQQQANVCFVCLCLFVFCSPAPDTVSEHP